MYLDIVDLFLISSNPYSPPKYLNRETGEIMENYAVPKDNYISIPKFNFTDIEEEYIKNKNLILNKNGDTFHIFVTDNGLYDDWIDFSREMMIDQLSQWCIKHHIDFFTKVYNIEIIDYPSKLFYVIGKDFDLNLQGCKLKIGCDNNKSYTIDLLDNIYKYKIVDNINFTEEGLYDVGISRDCGYCSFTIKVVKRTIG